MRVEESGSYIHAMETKDWKYIEEQRRMKVKYVEIEKTGVVNIKEKDIPKPQKGEALLKLLYGGICGSDLNSYRGKSPYTKYPVIPGHEFSAEIISIEDNELGLEAGMIVTANPYFNCGHCYPCNKGLVNCCTDNQTMGVQRNGGFAEYITMPIERIYNCNTIDPKQVALIEPFCIGYHGIKQADITKGDKVLVVGAGTIGVFAAISAKLMGATVYMCDIAEEKLNYAKEHFGIDGILINKDAQTFQDEVEKITDSNGFDVTVEAVGLPSTFLNCVEAASFGGQVVVIGVGKNNADFNFTSIQKKELKIVGSRNARKEDFLEAIEFFKNGDIKNLDKIITKSYDYTDAKKAFEDLDKNSSNILKISFEF